MEAPRKRFLWLMVAIILIGIAIGLYAWIAGIDLMGVLQDFFANPYVYLPLLFLYSFLVAIILPIPIELALLWPLLANDMVLYSVATVVMALGKTTGAWAVFHLGLRIEDDIRKWSKRFKFAETFVEWCTIFVRKTKYIGLFILLSIPLMTDTVPLYIYSLFNEDGKILNMRLFGAVNFFAAILRSLILFGLWNIGINLFG